MRYTRGRFRQGPRKFSASKRNRRFSRRFISIRDIKAKKAAESCLFGGQYRRRPPDFGSEGGRFVFASAAVF
ncbi:MAG: hypothetical protein DBY36_07595 [Clostridiales bacterium]|nr:MAG: hypothetical protein DBY36_07595 [Clostridiales bacterium]